MGHEKIDDILENGVPESNKIEAYKFWFRQYMAITNKKDYVRKLQVVVRISWLYMLRELEFILLCNQFRNYRNVCVKTSNSGQEVVKRKCEAKMGGFRGETQ